MEQLVLVLGLTVIAVATVKKFRLPSIIAFLLIGCLLGPYSLGVLDNTEQIKWLAEIGVVFLLFTIGLELPLAKFMEMRYNLLLIGSSQVFLCTLFMGVVIYAFDNSFILSLTAASALSLSSTAIIMRQLSEQNELFAQHGQLSFAMLIFQDIAVVPLLILLPLIAEFNQANTVSGSQMLWPVFGILIKGGIVFTIIIALSRTGLRRLFHRIAMTRSLELFMFAVLFVALLSAYITHKFGLSMSFGAFVAGIGLGESEFRHQIDAEIRPFRDILLGIFFVSIGMLLDLNIVINNISLVLLSVLAIVLIKFIVVTALCYYLGKKVDLLTAIKTGLIMAHAGEFGLAILTLATSYNIIYGFKAQIALAAMIISLFIAVLLTKFAGQLIAKFIDIFKLEQLGFSNEHTKLQAELVDEYSSPMVSHYPDLREHVIICGFGRVGKSLASILKLANKDYLCLETNSRVVRKGTGSDFNVYYGDCSSRRDILALANVENAKLVAICVDSDEISKKILANIKSLNTKVKVIVRTRDLRNSSKLMELGAAEVISETEEATMMLALKMLLMLDTTMEEAMYSINTMRQSRVDFFNMLMSSDKIG